MMRGLLQPMHLLVLLAIVLIIFGPGKLPELGASIGNAIKSFKKSLEEKEPVQEDKTDIKKIENK
jgi:sec-independent protein translocase protein TatA